MKIEEKTQQNILQNSVKPCTELLSLDRPKSDLQFKLNLERILEEHLDDDRFGINQVCKSLRISRMHLHRKIKKISDLSTSIFIRNYRLEKSKNILQSTNKKISQIAFEVGFKDPAYFCRCFKIRFDQSPTQLRQFLNKNFS